MDAFFHTRYYDNTILEWLISFGIIFGSVIVGKIVYWVCGTFVRKLTARTRTKLDDIIVDMVEEPLVFAITLAGIWYGLSRLNLSETAEGWISGVLQFLIVMCVAWLITRLADSLFTEFLAPLAEHSETDLDDQLLPLARKATKIIVWSIAGIVAANNAGYNSVLSSPASASVVSPWRWPPRTPCPMCSAASPCSPTAPSWSTTA